MRAGVISRVMMIVPHRHRSCDGIRTSDDRERSMIERWHESGRRERPQREQQCESSRAQRTRQKGRGPHRKHRCPIAAARSPVRTP